MSYYATVLQEKLGQLREKAKLLSWCLLLAALGMPPWLDAANTVMKISIVNRSGFSDDRVYFIIVSKSPLGYFDFRNRTIVETAGPLDVNTMVATLAQIKEYSGDGTFSIACPAMGSARIYFAFGKNFDQMGGFPLASGPEHGANNPVPWAMFEFDLSDGGFVNQSNVDFFSLAYTLTATRTTGEQVTVGITTPSSTIFDAFDAIPLPADSGQPSGNPQIFKHLLIRDAAGAPVRVVAPKTAGYVDAAGNATMPQMFTHFFDDYINNHCWRPGRTFSFSSKNANDPTTYYGRISGDGLTLEIYTNAAMTAPYAVPTLPRPSSAWGCPDFVANPSLWHNVGAASTAPEDIDWGYLLAGQDGYSSGPGAHWHIDPVVMSIPISIVRGVMHLDNGTVDWKNSANYYQGLNGTSTADFPIFYYAKIIHQYGIAGHVYALGFDDIYGCDSGISFNDPNVTLTLYPFSAPPALGPCIWANGRRTNVTVVHPETTALTVAMNAGHYAGILVDWWVVAIPNYGQVWYYLDSGMHWTPFSAGDLNACHPVHAGALGNITEPITVLPSTILPRGAYRIYFAVDYPMDGRLHYPEGPLLYDAVTVTVN